MRYISSKPAAASVSATQIKRDLRVDLQETRHYQAALLTWAECGCVLQALVISTPGPFYLCDGATWNLCGSAAPRGERLEIKVSADGDLHPVDRA